MRLVEKRRKDSNKNSSRRNKRKLNHVLSYINRFLERSEKIHMAEWIEFIENPRKVFKYNFLAGISRGLGSVIGATVVVVLLVYVLSFFVELNIPIIGEFISEIVTIVNNHIK